MPKAWPRKRIVRKRQTSRTPRQNHTVQPAYIKVNVFAIRGRWYYDYRLGGVRHKKSLKLTDRAAAISAAAAIELQLNSTPLSRTLHRKRTWEDKNWLKHLLARAKRATYERGIPCSLTLSDLESLMDASGGRCAMSGIEFDRSRVDGFRRRPRAPSLDRINSREGYHVWNVRFVCVSVNAALGEWGDEHFLAMCRAVVSQADLRSRSTEMPRDEVSVLLSGDVTGVPSQDLHRAKRDACHDKVRDVCVPERVKRSRKPRPCRVNKEPSSQRTRMDPGEHVLSIPSPAQSS